MGKPAKHAWIGCGVLAVLLLWTPGVRAADDREDWRALVASGQLVEINKYDRSIKIEQRYATGRNCMGAPVYAAGFPCLTRPETAVRLHLVEQMLEDWGYRLKIWDAYRPQAVQTSLWQRWAKHGFVANPDEGPGSLHTWGLAVDATMVDMFGRDVLMPSDFDVFSADASATYAGARRKGDLQSASAPVGDGRGGFRGVVLGVVAFRGEGLGHAQAAGAAGRRKGQGSTETHGHAGFRQAAINAAPQNWPGAGCAMRSTFLSS